MAREGATRSLAAPCLLQPESQLPALQRRLRPAERVRPQRRPLPVQPEAALGLLEERADLLRVRPLAARPLEPPGVVQHAAPHLPHAVEHPLLPLGEIALEPVLEQ